MWCVNPMVVDTWKADPYPGYPECQEDIAPAEEEEIDDKVTEHIPEYPLRPPPLLLTRSASCNRINLALPNRKPKRSLSTCGTNRRPTIVRVDSDKSVSTNHLEVESPIKEKHSKLKRSDSVLTRLARQYSFSRSRRNGSSSSSMSSIVSPVDSSTLVSKMKSPRRRRQKNSKKDSKVVEHCVDSKPKRLGVPTSNKHGRVPSPLPMNVSNINGNITSSPGSSCPNSPPHFKATFSLSPPSPSETKDSQTNDIRATSPISADESPPPTDDKSYDSGRMSMSSFRSFGSGRPTSLSSVTSSISSRTSRGSDYFSSASSCGQPDQQHQVTSYRLGLQTVLPEVDESDSVDRLVLEGGKSDCEQSENNNSPGTPKDDKISARAAAFVAHDRHDKSLKDIDHLAPVANLAMVVNPDLSYVDRVILELLETERMYVRSLQDILTGYLAKIRSVSDLKIHPNDVEDLFGNIRDIYDFNRKLLGEFEDCHGDPQRVAECFVSKDEDFKVYTKYCTNYPSSVAAMTRCMRIPSLAEFFKVQQDYLRHTLPLGSYLLKPVQRVLKYHLLLQELVKHCEKQEEGYQTIQNALQTMTRVARHINDMKRKHEDAVHIQEIQSLLTNWQGNELTTYGELIMENEMKMQGAKNERQVFLFEKMILITKRREDGYLVCKANIMCANLVLLESLPNNPLGFQIQPFSDKGLLATIQQSNNGQQESGRVPCYVLLAPSVEEKSVWTYHIKRLIIETLKAAVPLKAKKSIMRMKPMRDGDGGGGDSEEDRMRKKGKPRFGSNAILGNQDGKNNKNRPTKLNTSSSTNLHNGHARKASTTTPVVPNKPRRRSDSMTRKSLHKKALKRKDDVESSDEISTDSAPNTPSGLKVLGNFSFPGFRQSTRSSHVNQASKLTTSQAQSKSATPQTTSSDKKTAERNGSNKKDSAKTNQPEVVKRHHNSVVYRRHKRRTSQPITIIEKRLSMKIADDEDDSTEKNNEGTELNAEDDDLMNFSPLTARESVSWDIQIVEAIFDRYKKEGTSPVTPDQGENPNLGSTYMTVPSDVAPSPLMSLDHTPILSQRRKSRIVVVPSSESSDDNAKKKPSSTNSSIIRRKKDKSAKSSYRTSGVVYLLSKEKDTESDGGVNEAKSLLRKAAQTSENVRNSLVIHESDTDAETNKMLKEKAVTARRKTSIKRRERNNNRKKNEENTIESTPISETNGKNRRGSLYDNLDEVFDPNKSAITSSVQCMSTQTISVVYSSTTTSATLVSAQSSSLTSISSSRAHDVTSANCNNNNSKASTPKGKLHPVAYGKDTKHIPTGTVRGLIERMWNSPGSPTSPPLKSGAISPTKRTPVTSPTNSNAQKAFSFEPKSVSSTTKQNRNSNNNNNTFTQSSSSIGSIPVELHISEKSNCTSVVSSSSGPIMSHSQINQQSVQTTASLPLTLTSSSSSSSCDSEEESGPTIAQRVKRLSMGDNDHQQLAVFDQASEPKKTPPPQIFLRRTFSRDDNNSTTRHSTNLVLEARMSGEYAVENDSNFRKISTGEPKDDKKETVESMTQLDDDLSFTFGDSICEAKHYLFEKLCLTTPKESKITDKMSEEFEEFVCSDLESNLRNSSLESHTFSGSDEDGRRGRQFRRELSPLAQKTAPLLTSISLSPKTEDAKFDQVEKAEKPKIYGAKNTENTSGLRKYSQQYSKSVLPNRSDSIRSTRSEFTTIRNREPESRGRSLTQRSRYASRNNLPMRDMQAIPQKNVAKLAKQFSEICKQSEEMVKCPPRRSKSVEGGARMRHRMQARQRQHEKAAEITNNTKPDTSTQNIKSASSYDFVSTTSRSKTRDETRPNKYSIHTAAVVVDEKLVCQTVTSGQKTLAIVTSSNVSDDDNEVFPSSPKTPEDNHQHAKKMSLVEMFAANPKKSRDSEKEDFDQDNGFASSPEEEEIENITPGDSLLDAAKQTSPNVRVILVHKLDDGAGSLEPRVLNLDSRGDKKLMPPSPLEKRHSWTTRSNEDNKKQPRTRLRSSSLTRCKRKAILSPES